MNAWLWAAVGVGAAFLLLLAILAVPIDLRFEYASASGRRPRLRFEWLFGFIGRDLSQGTKKWPSKPKRRALGFAAMRRSGMVHQLLVLARRLLRRVRVRDFTIDIEISAGDPAETGMTYAIIGPASTIASAIPGTYIRVQPDFAGDAGIRGVVNIDVRAVPLTMVPTLLMFVFSPTTWRAFRAMRSHQ